MLEILKEAAAHVGGIGKLADAIGIARQNFYQWGVIPAERVVAIETATGGKVPRSRMRPDLWPPTQGSRLASELDPVQFNRATELTDAAGEAE